MKPHGSRKATTFRWLVPAVVAIVSALAAFFASRVGFDDSIEIWLMEDDTELVAYREFLDRFDADEFAVLAIFADDVFEPSVLRSIDRISRAAERVENVHRVRSLTNVEIFENSHGSTHSQRLVEELPETEEEGHALRERALAVELLHGTLVSEDGRAAAVIVELEPEGNNVEDKTEFMHALREIAAPERRDGLTIRFAGSPAIDEAFFQYSYDDIKVLLPACIFLVLLVTIVLFRSLSASLAAISVVSLSLLWVFGLMGLAGFEVTVISSAIVALILTVGVADSVHMLSEYRRCLRRGVSPAEAVRETVRNLFVPCLFTSATSGIGLLALMVSSLRPIREFACLAAFGVASAFVLTFVLIPHLLPLVRFHRSRRDGTGRSRLDVLIGWLARPGRKRSKVIVGVGALVLILSVGALHHLDVGINALNYFREGDPVREDIVEIDRQLGGSTSVEFVVETEDDGFKEPEMLHELKNFCLWMEELPGVTRTVSIVDFMKEVDRVWRGRGERPGVLPETRKNAADFFLLLEGEVDSLVQDNYSVARVTTRIRLADEKPFLEAFPAVRQRIVDRAAEAGFEVRFTGFMSLMARMEAYLLDSQMDSLALAFVVITVLMIVLLGSVRIGVFSMIPNFLPIMVGMAIMVPAGVSLDTGTVMIGPIALGLIVDDTIHFLLRFSRAVKRGDSVDDSIARTMEETGRPIIITSVILACGFLILTLGSFAPNANFGLVNAAVILLALLADLVLLPAALMLVASRVDLVRR